jgi:hypothetical protein
MHRRISSPDEENERAASDRLVREFESPVLRMRRCTVEKLYSSRRGRENSFSPPRGACVLPQARESYGLGSMGFGPIPRTRPPYKCPLVRFGRSPTLGQGTEEFASASLTRRQPWDRRRSACNQNRWSSRGVPGGHRSAPSPAPQRPARRSVSQRWNVIPPARTPLLNGSRLAASRSESRPTGPQRTRGRRVDHSSSSSIATSTSPSMTRIG